MNEAHDINPALLQPLIFLAAAVIAVPIFQRLRLGSVVGYLAAGIVIGPHVLGLFHDSAAIRSIAELGVVLLLFIIGLELKPSRLWKMRRDIFGFGSSQILLCGAVLGLLLLMAGFDWRAAILAGLGLSLSSTAFATPLMESRQELASAYGTRAFSILLMQDLAIVPLLALIPFLTSGEMESHGNGVVQIVIVFVALAVVILVGRHVLNPFFRILASSGAREIMTAAALLVVLGAALVMQLAGLSMAMGAFLAGVLLAESSFRHELEADIEPFRGLLLGLFFISVGMIIDLTLVMQNAGFIVCAVLALLLTKSIIIYVLARVTGSPHSDAVRIGGILAQGGEFAFVLFATATVAHVMSRTEGNLLVATVTISLALTPFVFMLANKLADYRREETYEEDFSDAQGKVLVLGFGRFGQVVSQFLLSQGIEVTAIDRDVESIRAASRFGFRVYYGEADRLDVLRAAGAGQASLIVVTVIGKGASLKIVDIVQTHFPLAKLYVRAYDRRHALELMRRNVDFQIRDTYESAVAFGIKALQGLGFSPEAVKDIEEDIRRRDEERLMLQLTEGDMAGANLMHTKPVVPQPLIEPKRTSQALNPEAAESIDEEEASQQ